MKKLFSLILLLGLIAFTFGQKAQTIKGHKAFKALAYQKAIKHYTLAQSQGSQDPLMLQRLADAYRMVEEPENEI